MYPLSSHRQGWDEIQEIETNLLRQMSVQESLQYLLKLQVTFEKQLQETDHLFAAERRAALAELQSRLLRLAKWQALHGNTVPIDPGNTNSPA